MLVHSVTILSFLITMQTANSLFKVKQLIDMMVDVIQFKAEQ